MEVTFNMVEYRVLDRRGHVSICTGDYSNTDHSFVVDLKDCWEGFREDYGPVTNNLYSAVHFNEVPESHDAFNALQFVKGTVEGQHLLEWVLSRYHVDLPLKLDPAEEYAEDGLELGSKEKWEKTIEVPDIDPTQRFLDEVNKSCNKYVYTIMLVDHDTDEEFYYVGESTKIMQRLETHVSRGGDFKEAKCRNCEVHEIVSIEPASEVSESDKYDSVCSRVLEGVFGGH